MLNQVSQRYRSAQSGFSLVELMVGITIGMIVVAGASVMMVNQVSEHRRLILETQVQQDLRAAADLMLRDLRRSGFWATPETGVWLPGSAAPPADAASNPYTAITVETPTQVLYSYSRASNYTDAINVSPGTPENNSVDANESFGFRLVNETLQFSLGKDNWQPLTDPNTLRITRFTVTPTVQQIPLGDYCATPCASGTANCPAQQIRRVEITLTGKAKHDDKVVRTLSVNSRIRNDRIVGSCA